MVIHVWVAGSADEGLLCVHVQKASVLTEIPMCKEKLA